MVTKLYRCVACGSAHVKPEGNTLHPNGFLCTDCGLRSSETMSAADLALINRIVLSGGTTEELKLLRQKYKNLDLTTWSSENRLEVR